MPGIFILELGGVKLHEPNPFYILLGAVIYGVIGCLTYYLTLSVLFWLEGEPEFTRIFRESCEKYDIAGPEKKKAMARVIAMIDWGCK